ncbi:hypothetical protein L9F63_001459 [Diploptera punctata]|uniref:Uncharacterized protein n=1 Tax=Diploptera punctata TaxID=6984 RepID=A0AAD8A4L1_DIPPU|nr:hypothetical protein L9F63_001459 [Diploptera punctata]
MYAEPSIKMLDAINNHKPAEALQEQRKLNNVIKIITRNGGWVATMKVAMGLMASIDMGPPRPPLVALTDAQIEQMKKELGALKLLH